MEEKKPTATQKPKRKRRTKAEMQKAKNISNLVPANIETDYMISETAREDCYVYEIQRVQFDSVLGREDRGAKQLVMFRQSQVHKVAIWKNGEIAVNVREKQLQVEYGAANVKLINDPYEYE